jgi:hypothetical protein
VTAWELRLGKADWDRFERGDEWVLFDDEHLYDSTPDELDQLERAMGGYRIYRFLAEWEEVGAQAMRAALWLARRRAGITEPWANFQPQVMRIDSRRPALDPGEGDAVPPEQPSPYSSTGDEPETSSSTSDPGSPASIPDSDPDTSAA